MLLIGPQGTPHVEFGKVENNSIMASRSEVARPNGSLTSGALFKGFAGKTLQPRMLAQSQAFWIWSGSIIFSLNHRDCIVLLTINPVF